MGQVFILNDYLGNFDGNWWRRLFDLLSMVVSAVSALVAIQDATVTKNTVEYAKDMARVHQCWDNPQFKDALFYLNCRIGALIVACVLFAIVVLHSGLMIFGTWCICN